MKHEQPFKTLLLTCTFIFISGVLGRFAPELQYNFLAILLAASAACLPKSYKNLSAENWWAFPPTLCFFIVGVVMTTVRVDVALTFVIALIVLLIADYYYPFL